MGFTEKHKIAFAQSQTVPVIHDGPKRGEGQLGDRQPPRRGLSRQAAVQERDGACLCALRQRLGRHRRASGAVSHGRSAIFTDRVRPVDQPYFRNRAASGWARPTSPPSRPRRARRASLPSARRSSRRAASLGEQKFLAGEQPAYPDYALAGAFLWARIASPLELLEPDDPVHAWRERMLDLFDGMGRKAKAA